MENQNILDVIAGINVNVNNKDVDSFYQIDAQATKNRLNELSKIFDVNSFEKFLLINDIRFPKKLQNNFTAKITRIEDVLFFFMKKSKIIKNFGTMNNYYDWKEEKLKGLNEFENTNKKINKILNKSKKIWDVWDFMETDPKNDIYSLVNNMNVKHSNDLFNKLKNIEKKGAKVNEFSLFSGKRILKVNILDIYKQKMDSIFDEKATIDIFIKNNYLLTRYLIEQSIKKKIINDIKLLNNEENKNIKYLKKNNIYQKKVLSYIMNNLERYESDYLLNEAINKEINFVLNGPVVVGYNLHKSLLEEDLENVTKRSKYFNFYINKWKNIEGNKECSNGKFVLEVKSSLLEPESSRVKEFLSTLIKETKESVYEGKSNVIAHRAPNEDHLSGRIEFIVNLDLPTSQNFLKTLDDKCNDFIRYSKSKDIKYVSVVFGASNTKILHEIEKELIVLKTEQENQLNKECLKENAEYIKQRNIFDDSVPIKNIRLLNVNVKKKEKYFNIIIRNNEVNEINKEDINNLISNIAIVLTKKTLGILNVEVNENGIQLKGVDKLSINAREGLLNETIKLIEAIDLKTIDFRTNNIFAGKRSILNKIDELVDTIEKTEKGTNLSNVIEQIELERKNINQCKKLGMK